MLVICNTVGKKCNYLYYILITTSSNLYEFHAPSFYRTVGNIDIKKIAKKLDQKFFTSFEAQKNKFQSKSLKFVMSQKLWIFPTVYRASEFLALFWHLPLMTQAFAMYTQWHFLCHICDAYYDSICHHTEKDGHTQTQAAFIQSGCQPLSS